MDTAAVPEALQGISLFPVSLLGILCVKPREREIMHNKIILNLAISLDGYIADANGGYEWIRPSGDHTLNTRTVWSHADFLEHVAAVVMGKRSYDQQLHVEYGQKQVYVATSESLEDYYNIHFIGRDVCSEVAALKRRLDGDVYLFGGGITIDPLLKAQMIDEYSIGIIPIILGEGIPLFLQDNPTIPLYLTNYYVEDGVVVMRYVPRKDVDG